MDSFSSFGVMQKHTLRDCVYLFSWCKGTTKKNTVPGTYQVRVPGTDRQNLPHLPHFFISSFLHKPKMKGCKFYNYIYKYIYIIIILFRPKNGEMREWGNEGMKKWGKSPPGCTRTNTKIIITRIHTNIFLNTNTHEYTRMHTNIFLNTNFHELFMNFSWIFHELFMIIRVYSWLFVLKKKNLW